MTTLHAQSNRGNKPPDAYKAHLDKLARDHETFLKHRRQERLLRRLVIASIIGLVLIAVIYVIP
jgi:hypothetical protein